MNFESLASYCVRKGTAFRSRTPNPHLFGLVRRQKGAYSHTINHPVFPFSIYPSPPSEEVMVKWLDFFQSQASSSRKRFVLHDGPPYANGDLHMGHALNKFLKDAINRYKILCGYSVHFTPGWDCHGLPIELKATKLGSNLAPPMIRESARKVAQTYVTLQKSSFASWGVLGDWSKSYTTMDPTFEGNEIKAFRILHEKGLIYRDFLPVHWSPATQTALAESELEYVNDHESPSVYLRVLLNRLPGEVGTHIPASKNVYAVIWTTTPWTLLANEAILFDPNSSYCLMKSAKSGDFYLVGSQFSEKVKILFTSAALHHVCDVPGKCLDQCSYVHPFVATRGDDYFHRPFLPSSVVVESKGTGLVHCAPCHGKEDFTVGQYYGLPLCQFVDRNGHFVEEACNGLAGLFAQTDGSVKVIELLESMVLFRDTIKHSYPYDWRTNTPVLTRLSTQWFLNTEKLTEAALRAYESVTVIPPSHKESLIPFLTSRSRWCISRQRSWGVPIPVLFKSTDMSPIVDYDFIDHVASRCSQSGSDFWYTESVNTIVPDQFWQKWKLTSKDVFLGTDVFDVWFDSGLSWLSVLGDSEIADFYVEGPDQFRGWFSASLILSVAIRGCAPYRSLLVHGWTSDSQGRKMSKSLGNVVLPLDLLKRHKGCIDILRHWALRSALDPVSSVGEEEIDRSADSYKSLRNSLRFMLGNLADFNPVQLLTASGSVRSSDCIDMKEALFRLVITSLPSRDSNFGVLDRAVLFWLSRLIHASLETYYPACRFNALLGEVDQFLSRLSSVYMVAVKDTLYCDSKDCHRRRSVQLIFWLVTNYLKLLMAPIAPHLMEKAESVLQLHYNRSLDRQCSAIQSSLFAYSENDLSRVSTSVETESDWLTCLRLSDAWNGYSEFADSVEVAHALYLSILNSKGQSTHSSPIDSLVSSNVTVILPKIASQELKNALQLLHPTHENYSSESELCQLFRAASIRYVSPSSNYATDLHVPADGIHLQVPFEDTLVTVLLKRISKEYRCPRCLRFTGYQTRGLCRRCEQVLSLCHKEEWQSCPHPLTS